MTPAQAARLIDELGTQQWWVLQYYVEEARAAADFSHVKALGVDETSRRRGHDHISVFSDLDPAHSRVLFAPECKDADTVAALQADLEAHGGQAAQLEAAGLDMSAAFIGGLREQLRDVPLTIDNFHLMQLPGQAVDQVRREVQRTHPELTRTRYVWLNKRMESHRRAGPGLPGTEIQPHGDGASQAPQQRLSGRLLV